MSVPQSRTDVIIIGGGAAGLMAAFTAGQRGKRVVVLEHQERVGKKILISGGGRCNFTNLHAKPENYLSDNPNFCKSALARYRPEDFIGLIKKHGIPSKEKKLGQQFCTGSSREIVDLLMGECAEARVTLETGCQVHAVQSMGERHFYVQTSKRDWTASALIVATGGLSYSNLGATDFGYRLAEQFGLSVTPLHPGLVPLRWNTHDAEFWSELSGVSLPVAIQHGKTRFQEALLFTHSGISGPAVLQISSYWKPVQPLQVNLLPDVPIETWFNERVSGVRTLQQHLAQDWPTRFLKHWSQQIGRATQQPIARLPVAERQLLMRQLTSWQLHPGGTSGYSKAEVTCGGVSTSELSSKTMECRRVPGLYFVGEVVDVTGWLGGYNFQWAWASGFAAGSAVGASD